METEKPFTTTFRTILVTGATGFVGKALTARLVSAGHTVYPFSLSAGYDVRNPDSFRHFIDKGIDTVIHCAGLTFVPDSWSNAAEFYGVNTLGTQHVLDFCRAVGARHIFISAYLYGAPQYLPIDEGHPVVPNNPYAHSKWLAEELCRFYAAEMGVDSVILRPFNLYGHGQPEDFLIPTIIRQARQGAEIVVKDDSPRRDFLYIGDFVDACILTLECRDTSFRVFNVGSGYSLSVREVIESVIHATGSSSRWRSTGEVRHNEIPDTVADTSAINRLLGWKPQLPFAEGCRRTVSIQEAL